MSLEAIPSTSLGVSASSEEKILSDAARVPQSNSTTISISNSEAETQSIVLEQLFGPQASNSNLGDSFVEVVRILAELFAKTFGVKESEANTTQSQDVSPTSDSEKSAGASTVETSNQAKLGFAEKLKQVFAGREGELIYEDELQQEIISYQLYQKDPALETQFKQLVAEAKTEGLSMAESSVSALQEFVKRGLLEAAEAEWVNGLSFRAAQLDTKQNSLASSESDSGFLLLSDALKIAEATLAGIQAGGVEASYRELSLDAASSDAAVFRSANDEEREGFLWKPISEADGNLVVLLPQSFTGGIEDVALYQGETVTESSKIEQGHFAGDEANGQRAHYRFELPGAAYGTAVTLGVTLEDGRNLSFSIPNAGERLSYAG